MSVSAPERMPRPLSPRWWVTDRDGRAVVLVVQVVGLAVAR